MKWWQGILTGIGIALAVLIGFLCGEKWGKNPSTIVVKEKVDTLIVRDTITALKPIYVERVKMDSILVPVCDTIRMQDTLYVYLEREKVTWRDSLCEVYASGVYPSVDSVRHFITRYEIVKEIPVKERCRWGIGINAGYGASKDGLSPYLGIGITYNILSF